MPSSDPLNMIFFVFRIIIIFYDTNEIPQKMTFGNFSKSIAKRKQTNIEAKGNPQHAKSPQGAPKVS
jgi:hypothetical protein